jgi:cyclase
VDGHGIERPFRPRVIPVLLLRDGLLHKPVRFRDPKYVGDPRVAVKILNDKGADEIVLLDMSARRRGGPDFALVEEIAGECFMPMAYGGGITDADQARRILGLGVEKVVLGTAAIDDGGLVTRIADAFGRQAVAICVDVAKPMFGGARVYAEGGSRKTDRDPVTFARDMDAAGAGEILLQAIEREGTGKGYDLDLIRQVAGAVDIPVVALGGAGRIDDFRTAIDAGASAAAAATIFVLHGPHRAVLVTYPPAAELEALFA